MENISEMYQGMLDAGNDWADKNAAAQLLEETKKVMVASGKNVAVDEALEKGKSLSDAASERMALDNDVYRLFIKNMVQARKEANKARVKYDSIKVYNELARSVESTRREEMKLV